jgi:pheromone shutdown protein TraB
MSEPERKTGRLMHQDTYKRLLKDELRTGIPSFTVLDERPDSVRTYITLNRNLPYIEQILQKVNDLITSGIVQKFHDNLSNNHIPSNKEEEVEPQILTMTTLGLGLSLFLMACVLCIISFVIELLTRIFQAWFQIVSFVLYRKCFKSFW